MGVQGLVWNLVGNLMGIRAFVVEFSGKLGFSVKFSGELGLRVAFSEKGQFNRDSGFGCGI